MADERILFVDDDPAVLDTYQRLLMEHFSIDTALGAEKGLQLLAERGPFAVVISDYKMPVMNGIEFLSRVRETAPETVRMMLTGNADLHTAMQAVNEGHIFRFLTKPCPPDTMLKTLTAGTEQYRLLTAEKELLENTLKGTIRLLTDILSLVDPDAFGRTVRMRDAVRQLAHHLKVKQVWQIELAWMLSQIGYVTLPPDILVKKHAGHRLTKKEEDLLARVPQVGRKLLSNIPRLEAIATIIAYQEKHYDGTGVPEDDVCQDDIPIGARIIKVVSDLAQLRSENVPLTGALRRMRNCLGHYDPKILDAAHAVLSSESRMDEPETVKLSVRASELCINDRLRADLYSIDGGILITAGTPISEIYLERTRNFARFRGVKEPIQIERPLPHREPHAKGELSRETHPPSRR